MAALRFLGVDLGDQGDGPFRALADGNRMLRPFHKCLKHTRLSDITTGRYVRWSEGHFYAVIIKNQVTEADGSKTTQVWRVGDLANIEASFFYRMEDTSGFDFGVTNNACCLRCTRDISTRSRLGALILRDKAMSAARWKALASPQKKKRAEAIALREMQLARPFVPRGWPATPMPGIPEDFTKHLRLPKLCLLSTLNSHERDDHLQFFDETHTYLIDGERSLGSVTGLIHSFSEEFDAKGALALMKKSPRWPRPGYLVPRPLEAGAIDLLASMPSAGLLVNVLRDTKATDEHICGVARRLIGAHPDMHAPVVKALALDDDAVFAKWNQNRDDAAGRGTWMHWRFEAYLNRAPVDESGPEFTMFLKYVSTLSGLTAFRTEWMIYGDDERLAGSIDFVAEDAGGGLHLFDWKRSRNLFLKYTNQFRRMKDPLDHLEDAQGIHYRLQLNAYKYLIEKYYKRRVVSMAVVCLHPDNGDTAFVDQVPEMPEEIMHMMESQRRRAVETSGVRVSDYFHLDPPGGGGGVDESQPESSGRPFGASQDEALFADSAQDTIPGVLAPGSVWSLLDGGETAAEETGPADSPPASAKSQDGDDNEGGGGAAGSSLAEPGDETLLNISVPLDASNRIHLEKRKRFPGAPESNPLFDAEEMRVLESIQRLSKCPRREDGQKEGIIYVARRHMNYVKKEAPGWNMEMMRVATAMLVMYHLRLADVASPELVQIVWTCLGDIRLRSHGGVLRFFNTSSGSWSLYTGLFPEGVFGYLRDFMNKVEGAFRSFEGKVAWDQKGIIGELKRIVNSQKGVKPEEKHRQALNDFKNAAFWNRGDGRGARRRDTADIDSQPPGSQPPAGDEDGGREQEPEETSTPTQWYLHVARALKSLTPKMTRQLGAGGDVVKNFTEWCETYNPRVRGLVYRDRAVLYDVDGVPVQMFSKVDEKGKKIVTTQAEDNFYLSFPSALMETEEKAELSDTEGPEIPLEDPYLKDAARDINLYLRQTFWCNYEGLMACRAALALAKRGLNVIQCFIFYGAGGCGLSLFTELLASSIGNELHKYYDPYLFFDEEELRKTVELLSGGIVFSGQERPQGTKRKLLVHLWKKFLSGEGLRGRLPYAILTRMIRLTGWVRMEVNSVLPFGTLGEDEFESIMRRSCVIKVFARFFDKQYLDKHLEDHQSMGIFARRLELSVKFQSSAYAAAWNRTQHCFEERHGEQDCQDIIANFTRNGGDRNLTERFMRDSCNLPRRDESAAAATDGHVAGCIVETDAQETLMGKDTSGEQPRETLRRFAIDLMKETNERNLNQMTLSYFKQRNRRVNGLQLTRDQLYAAVVKSGLWRRCELHRGKHKDGAIIPNITCKVKYHDIVKEAPEAEQQLVLQESVNAEAVLRIFGPDSVHADNRAVILGVLKDIIPPAEPAPPTEGPALKVGRKRGRPSVRNQTEEAAVPEGEPVEAMCAPHVAAVMHRLGKTQANLRIVQEIVDHYKKPSAASQDSAPSQPGPSSQSPSRMRLTSKRKSTNGCENKVPYKPSRPWASRDFVKDNLGGQRLPQFVQEIISPRTIDIDISNCMFTVLHQLIRLMQIEKDIKAAFREELDLLEQLANRRDDLCKNVLKVEVQVGKAILNAVAMGQSVPAYRFKKNDGAISLLEGVAKLARFVRWLAATCMPDELAVLAKDSKVNWAYSSCASFFWQGAEAMIMRKFLDFVRQKPAAHVSLQFDGARIDRKRIIAEHDGEDADESATFCRKVAMHVAFECNGFRPEFKRKAHEAFVTLLTADVTLTDATSHITFPDWLRTENSCVRAVYCLMKDDEAAIEHIKTRWGRLGLAEIISFQQDPVTIESVMVAWKMKPWRPYVGYTLDFIGTAVLMVTIEQEPACVGLCINRDDSAIVYTGTSCITLSKNQLEAKLAASTDRFMMTTYIVSISRGSFPGREDESKDDAYKRLLHCKCR